MLKSCILLTFQANTETLPGDQSDMSTGDPFSLNPSVPSTSAQLPSAAALDVPGPSILAYQARISAGYRGDMLNTAEGGVPDRGPSLPGTKSSRTSRNLSSSPIQ